VKLYWQKICISHVDAYMIQAQIYHTDEKWQAGQSHGKYAGERLSLFNEQ